MCSDLNEVFAASLKLFGITPEEYYACDDDVEPSDEQVQWPEIELSDAAQIILKLIQNTTNVELLCYCIEAIAEQSELFNGHINQLAYLIDSKSVDIRSVFIELLTNYTDYESVNLLVKLSSDESNLIRIQAVAALANLPLECLFRNVVREALVNALDDVDGCVGEAAITGLVRIKHSEVYGVLLAAIEENQLDSEHFDAITQYGAYKFNKELLELKARLMQNGSYQTNSDWWRESFEELLLMSELEFNIKQTD